jgi:hypothetical protein
MFEQSNFPSIDQDTVRGVVVDLQEVSFVNSFGIQRWVKWLREIQRDAPDVSLRIENVSAVTAHTMAFIRELLPKTIVVDSVFVALSCAKCETPAPDLLVLRTNPQNVSAKILACVSCGERLVPESHLDQNLWFWKV